MPVSIPMKMAELRWPIPCAAIVFSLPLLHAEPAVWFVTPDGNDAWSGHLGKPNAARTDGPLASLAGASAALRKSRASGGASGPVRVVIAGGLYHLEEPWRLKPGDGGTASAPVRYEAAPDAKPVFTGGRAILGWRRGPDGVWRTRLPAVAEGKWYFEQLWINGRRATRARFPNAGWNSMSSVTEETLEPAKPVHRGRARQTVRTTALGPLAHLPPEALRDVNLIVFHKWDNTRRFIERVDAAAGTLTTTGEMMKPWNRWDPKSLWIAENARAFLDEPGEWFLARDGTLEYLPLPGEDMSQVEAIAPALEQLVEISGHPDGEKPIAHLTIQGLSFRHSQWITPPGGFEPCQAAATIGAAVTIDAARSVTLEDCEVRHVGTYGVWFRRGCKDSAMKRCLVEDLGAGGARIGETELRTEASAATGGITLDNNIIRHGGTIFPCAVGVWIGHSPDNRVLHNEICHFQYTGISMGWRWGYGPSACKRNTVAFNHVHHLGAGPLSDLGGIYTLGPSEGSVVSDNVFHDITSRTYGGWGLYTDEGSTGILFERNLVHHTKTGGFHQHYGRDNTIRNNIFAHGIQQQLQATRVENHRSFVFENNIVFWSGASPALSGPWDRIRHESAHNCYWNTAQPVNFLGRDLAAWQNAGHETKSLTTDPGFINPSGCDFRLKPGSPVLALGFKPFDVSTAGVYGCPQWIRLANPPKSR